MSGVFRFVVSIIWLGIALSTLGTLNQCTRVMLGYAVESNQKEVMSLGAWNRKLNQKR